MARQVRNKYTHCVASVYYAEQCIPPRVARGMRSKREMWEWESASGIPELSNCITQWGFLILRQVRFTSRKMAGWLACRLWLVIYGRRCGIISLFYSARKGPNAFSRLRVRVLFPDRDTSPWALKLKDGLRDSLSSSLCTRFWKMLFRAWSFLIFNCRRSLIIFAQAM